MRLLLPPRGCRAALLGAVSCARAFRVGGLAAPRGVLEYSVHLVVLEATDGADGEAELHPEVHRRIDLLEGAQAQDDAAVLQGDVDTKVGRQRRGEELRRDGVCLPGGVGPGGERLALEEGGGLGEGVGEDAEGGGEGLRVGPAGEGQGEEVDGLGEAGVEVVQGVDVDGMLVGEGERLAGEGVELDVQRLHASLV